MYQALYRTWRPTSFADMVGQEHITRTLSRQIQANRLSHAYLLTGTRGTGKTTCAKVLAKAVNCDHPQNGNPCNLCPSCIGINDGSVMDVLELDAASNNGVDQVRALRDEAVYTPATVKKRVYIIDEVHMLSPPAFNALLKILEEPPPHVLFILATTELHKISATIRSRCQHFSFKRIATSEISSRLLYVADKEQIPLTSEGSHLLARLASGGLRDALSLLDQCRDSDCVDESHILKVLGLVGNVEIAQLTGQILRQDTERALLQMGQLYESGKDISSILSELSMVFRDLLLLKTAPKNGESLLTGGYDQSTLTELGQISTAPVLLHCLNVLQETAVTLSSSKNRRTDGELALLRICEPSLDESVLALSSRIDRLEERIKQSAMPLSSLPIPAHAVPPNPDPPVAVAPIPVAPVAMAPVPVVPVAVPPNSIPPVAALPVPVATQPPPVISGTNSEDDYWASLSAPAWLDEDAKPDALWEEYEAELSGTPVPVSTPPPSPVPRALPTSPVSVAPPTSPVPVVPVAPPPVSVVPVSTPISTGKDGVADFWYTFLSTYKKNLPPMAFPYLNNPQKVNALYSDGRLTLLTDSAFTKLSIEKPVIRDSVLQNVSQFLGTTVQLLIQINSGSMNTTPPVMTSPVVTPPVVAPPVVAPPVVAPPVVAPVEGTPVSVEVPTPSPPWESDSEEDPLNDLMALELEFNG